MTISLHKIMALVTTIGTYFAEFHSHLSSGSKTGLGAAFIAMVTTLIHEEHATNRNGDSGAASVAVAAKSAEAVTSTAVATTGKQIETMLGGLIGDLSSTSAHVPGDGS